MPLIQWIMQNLGKTFAYDGSGTITVYGSAVASFSENLYGIPIKFAIGAKAFDLSGSVWTITGISASSGRETKYTARRGTTTRTFYDSEILVNQQRFSCVELLQSCLDAASSSMPTYAGFRIEPSIRSRSVAASCLDSLQRCLDKPMENLPTYSGIRKVKA